MSGGADMPVVSGSSLTLDLLRREPGGWKVPTEQLLWVSPGGLRQTMSDQVAPMPDLTLRPEVALSKFYIVALSQPQLSAAPILPRTRRSDRWFYLTMALVTFAIVIIGFGPATFNPAGRRLPITPLVAAHGMIFSLWLALFLAQTTLVATGRVAVHRRLGYAGALLAIAMIISGFMTSVAMGRRGFDLSGDLRAERDPLALMVFQLGDIVSFTILVAAAIWYRRRPDIHKRLMLFATVGALMPAPLTHLLSHIPRVRDMDGLILVPLVLLLFSSAINDRLSRGRIHPLSLWVPIAMLVWANLRAFVIGPSEAWHRFAGWLVG